jgi:hypothetical protein
MRAHTFPLLSSLDFLLYLPASGMGATKDWLERILAGTYIV